MFNLINNFCIWVSKLQQPIRNVTVLVVGLDKVGKTLCIRGMLRASHGAVNPTHGCVLYKLRLENFLVNLLDMDGSVEFRSCWREYYREAHGLIFVVDSSDRHRMKEVKELLTDILSQSTVAGKPLLVLANKQDKMKALLGSELTEVLSLEKLVNQSQSLCHIEPCSALMDLQRWSDRRTLRGLRWLLLAVCLNYPELCARVVSDCERPTGPEERERKENSERRLKKNKVERLKVNKSNIHQAQCRLEEKQTSGSHLQPVILKKENSLKKKLKKKKLKVTINEISVKRGSKNEELDKEQDDEEAEGNEAKQDGSSQKKKARSTLLSQKNGRLKPKAKMETLDHSESQDSKHSKAGTEQNKKMEKMEKGKRKNKLNTEDIPVRYKQPDQVIDNLSAPFDLYRKAILTLKAHQDQSLVPEQ